MNELQWAKLLQIAGILIGTGFGSILLNPDVMEKLSISITNRFLKEGDSWSDTLNHLEEFLPQVSEVPGVKPQHFSALLMFLNWVLLLISYLFNIILLLWISIGFIILALLSRVVLHTVKDLFIQKQSFWTTIKRILMAWLYGLIISPIFHFTSVVLYYGIRLLVFIFHSVARKNVVRRRLIISGFIFVFIGLVWEFFLIKS